MVGVVARPAGTGNRGCHLTVTPGGRVRVCFSWGGRPFRITTDLRARVPEHMERARQVRDLVGAEIRAGVFVPEARFPSYFAPRVAVPATPPDRGALVPELRRWTERLEQRGVRPSRTRAYHQHRRAYIEPHFGRAGVRVLTEREPLEGFLVWLVSRAGAGGKGVSEKTAANVMRGTLRAFARDAGLSLAAFDALRWERYVPGRVQDPFTPDEEARLLNYIRARNSYGVWATVRLAFGRGCRLSELAGLQVGDYDRATRSFMVNRSRVNGVAAATKTVASRRPVYLDAELVAVLEPLIGMRGPDEWLFRVQQATVRKAFERALVALGIRHRGIGQARHTCAIRRLLAGDNPTDVARGLGHSLGTLEKYYAAALRRRAENATENATGRTAGKISNGTA